MRPKRESCTRSGPPGRPRRARARLAGAARGVGVPASDRVGFGAEPRLVRRRAARLRSWATRVSAVRLPGSDGGGATSPHADTIYPRSHKTGGNRGVPMSDLTKLYVAANAADAHILRGLLEQEGIQAIVRGDDIVPLQGGNLFKMETRPSVWVFDDEHVARARELADDFGRPAASDRPRPPGPVAAARRWRISLATAGAVGARKAEPRPQNRILGTGMLIPEPLPSPGPLPGGERATGARTSAAHDQGRGRR